MSLIICLSNSICLGKGFDTNGWRSKNLCKDQTKCLRHNRSSRTEPDDPQLTDRQDSTSNSVSSSQHYEGRARFFPEDKL